MKTEAQYIELSEKLSVLEAKVSAIHSLLDSQFERLHAKMIGRGKYKRKEQSLYSRIVSAAIVLAQKKNRPVSNSEIIAFLNLNGTFLGKTKIYQNAFLNANLSNEIRKPDARIVRTSRGFYDVRDLKKGEEKSENEDLKT